VLGDGDAVSEALPGVDGLVGGEGVGDEGAVVDATMVKEKGRLRAFWRRGLAFAGAVGPVGVSGPRGRHGGETFGEGGIGGDLAWGQGEGRGGRR
jgi:hypothetical protein